VVAWMQRFEIYDFVCKKAVHHVHHVVIYVTIARLISSKGPLAALEALQ
jgi:hypothetical protein